MRIPTWKLTLEYDGTRYSGWQEQKNARTVAGEVRRAAEELLSKQVEILGSGRTDAGVHAAAQVARLRSSARATAKDLLVGINDRLPTDINVLRVEETHSGFDPRRDAVARYYVYQISTRRTAFAKRFVWWVKDRLDFTSMELASRSLAGRHDFARFCEKRDEDRSTFVLVKTIEMAVDGDLILLRIGASHFLWKMVRRIVGALVEVGRRDLSASEFAGLLDTGPPVNGQAGLQIAAHTAPPSGLFLERVVYDTSSDVSPLKPVFPVCRL
jgi:tRNA pseudouridine38-40 synthase